MSHLWPRPRKPFSEIGQLSRGVDVAEEWLQAEIDQMLKEQCKDSEGSSDESSRNGKNASSALITRSASDPLRSTEAKRAMPRPGIGRLPLHEEAGAAAVGSEQAGLTHQNSV
ncbi:hypothetical protein TspCOW1_00480 [Thiohalobacter sp. COW1]|nr:hypothetical protein TspCOW1_00480 [Thiohalobacter sp. COW1]